jgi:hypothetical protein
LKEGEKKAKNIVYKEVIDWIPLSHFSIKLLYFIKFFYGNTPNSALFLNGI